MAIVNLGILAHVDAGKTTLTERILFETGVIREIGRVDKGTTQTDTLDLERARGITIKSAVVSFQIDDLKVNLIDTPGHADFTAEVERSMAVLDGVALVISAVEGVQPQTRRLARAIRSAGLPMLIFVNKIDRAGARDDALLDDIRRKLGFRVVPITAATSLGDRSAEVQPRQRDAPDWREAVIDLLAETSERVIAEFDRSGGNLDRAFLESEMRCQVATGDIVPVYFGSAVTGAGVPELLAGIEEWLPRACDQAEGPLSASVFKIARRPTGEKIVYARLASGTLNVRDKVVTRRRTALGEIEEAAERVTGIDHFAGGVAKTVLTANAGEIVCLHGMRATRISDCIGDEASGDHAIETAFPPPSLESVVRPADPGQITQLRAALEQLAEQDPLISLRQHTDEGEPSVRLYGEVQKEVIQETLALDYGIAVHFGPSRTICIEQPVGTGGAVEIIGESENPYYGTVGIRVEPGEPGTGISYERELGSLPPAFYRAIEETIHETLTQGLCAWEVTDIQITLTHAGFWAPLSTAGDFRKLTPLVLMEALRQAGTVVSEPVDELELEVPEDTFGPVCGALVNARAELRNVESNGSTHRIVCEVPSVELRAVEHLLPGLTRGEGDWETHFAGYRPVSGDPPRRPRTGPNPLDRAHYLAEVAR